MANLGQFLVHTDRMASRFLRASVSYRRANSNVSRIDMGLKTIVEAATKRGTGFCTKGVEESWSHLVAYGNGIALLLRAKSTTNQRWIFSHATPCVEFFALRTPETPQISS